MPRKPLPDYYVATSSGVFKIDGKTETIIAGKTIVSRSSPLYRELPHYFIPVARPAVESATAAPGETR